MSKHTPGPWSLPFITERPIQQEVFGPDERIARVELPGNSRHDEQVANARLIAAAPELLDALEKLLHETDEGTQLCAREFAEQAKAAIAKAKGG